MNRQRKIGHFVGNISLSHIEQLERAICGRRVKNIVFIENAQLLNIVTEP